MKRKDFIGEIKSLSLGELKTKAAGIAQELMKLRFKNASGQFEQTHQLNTLRRDLARVQTFITVQKKAAVKKAA